MSSIRATFARVAAAFGLRGGDDEINEEMQAHLDMEIADNIRRGMHPMEARRRAMMAAGGITQAADAVRDRRGLPWLESIGADVRYAVRGLRRAPAFTLVAVITLALGIGANTAIFSVVRGVLLKPLPHRDGDRLVYLRQSADAVGEKNVEFSVPEVADLRAGAKSFGGIAEYSPFTLTMQRDDGAVHVEVGLVTGNFFDVMGLSPVLGRLTNPADDGTGVTPVMVLTHDYWMKAFGGDSSVIGTQVRIGTKSATVIGVLEPAPYFPDRVDAFFNMVISDHHVSAQMVQNRSHRMTEVIARLAPGATLKQARHEVDAVAERMRRDHPEAYEKTSHYEVSVIPFKTAIGEHARLTLLLLMAAAAFVLIISAANVVNLTLMRGVRREHELVVRAAMGAGVARLRRLLLVENLVLAVSGAALGVGVALGAMKLLISFAERYSPRAGEIRLDTTVLAFTFALAFVIALILSFASALPREGNFAAWISSAGRRISGGLRKNRLQRGLVVAQIAVSVVLLAGAGLLVRTMIRLSEVDTGLSTQEVLTMSVPLLNFAQLDFTADATNKDLYEQMRREIRALPGVLDVGIGSSMPLRTPIMSFDIKAESQPVLTGSPPPHADFKTASPEYFSASGIPILHGRPFSSADRAGAPRVVVINQAFADRVFHNENPIGKRVALTGEVLRFTPFTDDWRTIVGVAGNTHDGGMDVDPKPAMYAPFAQELAVLGGIVIRTDGDAKALAPAATRIVHRIAPGAPIENVLTVSQIRDESISPRRLNAALISAFGLLAVIIAAVGIGGVLAFSVSARTTEIGIRMSIGADRGRVQRMILSEGGQLVAIGLAVGIAGALFATRLISGLLFGVAAHDPVTFAVVMVLMAAIGLLGCWIPAARAARVDPAVTMRA